jgi:hypothetical protein
VHEPDVPIYVTEYGWVASPPGNELFAPPSRRARYIQTATEAVARSGCGVAAVLLFTWMSPERDPALRDDWYGIRHPDDGTTPALGAFARAVSGSASAAAPPAGACHRR